MTIRARNILLRSKDALGLTRRDDLRIQQSHEYETQKLLNSGAPIDAFGVRTRLTVTQDASDLDMACPSGCERSSLAQAYPVSFSEGLRLISIGCGENWISVLQLAD
jgi:hypothetical protein